MPSYLRLSVPVMAARWASVTLAQLLTPEMWRRIPARTAAVRPQMPVVCASA